MKSEHLNILDVSPGVASAKFNLFLFFFIHLKAKLKKKKRNQ